MRSFADLSPREISEIFQMQLTQRMLFMVPPSTPQVPPPGMYGRVSASRPQATPRTLQEYYASFGMLAGGGGGSRTPRSPSATDRPHTHNFDRPPTDCQNSTHQEGHQNWARQATSKHTGGHGGGGRGVTASWQMPLSRVRPNNPNGFRGVPRVRRRLVRLYRSVISSKWNT